MAQKSRNWCITIFLDWEEDDVPKLSEEIAKKYGDFQYFCIGYEVCPDTKNKHAHIYVEYKNARHFNAIKKIDTKSHIEARKGTAKQAEAYAQKDGLFVCNGERSKQGKRTDLAICRELIIEDGLNMKDAIFHMKSSQSIRTAECLLKYFEKKRDWKPTVYWLYGKTGTGKTRQAVEFFKNNNIPYWTSMKNLKWWEGYDGEGGVLIDDFRADFCTFHELLRILDRYEYRIEVKGGSRQLLSTHMIITSPMHPSVAYNKSEEDVKQLLRRIDLIAEITETTCLNDEIENQKILDMI